MWRVCGNRRSAGNGELAPDVLEPEDLAVGRIEKRHPVSVDVESSVDVHALRVTLGLGENVLGPEGHLLGFDDTEELAIND